MEDNGGEDQELGQPNKSPGEASTMKVKRGCFLTVFDDDENPLIFNNYKPRDLAPKISRSNTHRANIVKEEDLKEKGCGLF